MNVTEKNRKGSMNTAYFMVRLIVVEVLATLLKSLLYSLFAEKEEMLDLFYVSLSVVICLLMIVLPLSDLYRSAFLEISEEEGQEKEKFIEKRKNVVKLVFCLFFLFLGALTFIVGIVLSDYIGPRANILLEIGFFSVIVLSFLLRHLLPDNYRKEIKKCFYLVFTGAILVSMIVYNVFIVQHWPVHEVYVYIVLIALFIISFIHSITLIEMDVSEIVAAHYHPLGRDLTFLSYATLLYWSLNCSPLFFPSLDLLKYRNCPHYCEVMRASKDGSEESLRRKDLEQLKLQTFGVKRYNWLAEQESILRKNLSIWKTFAEGRKSKESGLRAERIANSKMLYVNKMEKDGKEGWYVFENIDDDVYGHLDYAPLSWYLEKYVLPHTYTSIVPAEEKEEKRLLSEAERRSDSLFVAYCRMSKDQRKASPYGDWANLYWHVKLMEKSGAAGDLMSGEKAYVLRIFVDEFMDSDIFFRGNMKGRKYVTMATDLYIITDADDVEKALLACGVLEDNIHVGPWREPFSRE